MIQSITGQESERVMQGDNLASIQQLTDPGYYVEDQRTRHFALRCAYVRDHLVDSDMKLHHCPGAELPANGLKLARNMLGMYEDVAVS